MINNMSFLAYNNTEKSIYMANFTLEEYTFLNNDETGDGDMRPDNICEDLDCSPKELTISKILGYSKALSIRKSSYLNNIKMIIN